MEAVRVVPRALSATSDPAPPSTLQGSRIVITGGCSGIGRSLALAFAKAGAHLMLIGRRIEPLDETAKMVRRLGVDAFTVSADITSQAARQDVISLAVRSLGQIDIFVNNAGGVRAGRIEEIDEADLLRILDVNLIAPIMLTREVVPFMRVRKSGLIVNIASGIALVGIPFYATYAASKAGLARFGESLRRELDGEGVRVLTVYPGGTDTPMMITSNVGPELGFTRESPDAVAIAIIEAILRGDRELTLGGSSQLELVTANHYTPEIIDELFHRLRRQLVVAVSDHHAL
ncbi:MAG: SDR family oxidoreductase [Ferrovibrio sp.]